MSNVFTVTKNLGGYPCSHRQWRDDGRCAFLHGYDRWIQMEWQGERDYRGWVVDFGGLKELKQTFEHQFDHTCLIAEDDPYMSIWQQLHDENVIDMRIMDPTIEGMTLWVAEKVQQWTQENYETTKLIRVTCFENEKNSASWKP